MRWEILILTMPTRRAFLSQLLSQLEPQISALGLRKFDQIDIRIKYSNPNLDLGTNRERLRRSATADYISFVDDDDLVEPHFISSLLPHLDGVADQVTFDFHVWHNGSPLKLAKHSLAHGKWHEDEKFFYRDLSHCTPMRRELALEVPMEGGFGEDHRWCDKMRGRVKTENHVDAALYYYLARAPKNDLKDPENPKRMELLERLKLR